MSRFPNSTRSRLTGVGGGSPSATSGRRLGRAHRRRRPSARADLSWRSWEAGADAAALVCFAGGLAFFAADWVIDRRGGEHRKRSGGQQAGGSGAAIALGRANGRHPGVGRDRCQPPRGERSRDGVRGRCSPGVRGRCSPVEHAGGHVGRYRHAHRGSPARYILGLWTGVLVVSAAAALAGYALLGGAGENVTAFIQAFAAGAILTMLADTMMPEAFEEAGSIVGLLTLLGFVSAFLWSRAPKPLRGSGARLTRSCPRRRRRTRASPLEMRNGRDDMPRPAPKRGPGRAPSTTRGDKPMPSAVPGASRIVALNPFRARGGDRASRPLDCNFV